MVSLVQYLKLVFSICLITNLYSLDLPTITDNENIKIVKDDKLFNTNIIKDKKTLLNYVDPDERDLNKEVMDKLEVLQPDINSIAIINLDATWLPNVILEGILKTNQEEHPNTIFVKDFSKELVKLWKLEDDNYNVLVFDKDGKIIFKEYGKLSKDKEEEFLKLLMY